MRAAIAFPLLALACGGVPIETTKGEDKARRTVPVPVCVQPLSRSTSGISTVQPADYWKMVLPAYDVSSQTVESSSPDCAGRQAFAEADVMNAEGPRSSTLAAKPENAVISPGPDQFRVVWLRTFRFADDSWSGPIALTRPREGYAEVYGTGYFRGKLKSTRFSLERMGSRILVAATDEGCGDVKPGQGCETNYTVFLLGGGRLTQSAQFALDRTDYRPFGGMAGVAKYRLTATPVFGPKSLRVVEQVIVQDPNHGVVRKADLERTFRLDRNGTLESDRPSLWAEISAGPAQNNPAPNPNNKPKPR